MIFSWTLLEKRPNPKTLKRFAVPHLLAKSTASEMRINFTRLFKFLRQYADIRHVLLKEKRKVNFHNGGKNRHILLCVGVV